MADQGRYRPGWDRAARHPAGRTKGAARTACHNPARRPCPFAADRPGRNPEPIQPRSIPTSAASLHSVPGIRTAAASRQPTRPFAGPETSQQRLLREVSVATDGRNNRTSQLPSSNQHDRPGLPGRRDTTGRPRLRPVGPDHGGLAGHVPGRPARVHLGQRWPAPSRPRTTGAPAQTFWAFSFFVDLRVVRADLHRDPAQPRASSTSGGRPSSAASSAASSDTGCWPSRTRSGRPTSATRCWAASAPGWSTPAASTSWPSGTRRRRAGGPAS